MSTEPQTIDSWKEKHILKIRDDKKPQVIENEKLEGLSEKIEPWLTALFQSEHLSLLVGAGLSSAVHFLAQGNPGAGMSSIPFSVFTEQIKIKAEESALKTDRGEANIEDQIRIVNDLIRGLDIYTSHLPSSPDEDPVVESYINLKSQLKTLKTELSNGISEFAETILHSERNIVNSENASASEYLMSFLLSFASRVASRDRLNIFTLNYDRVLELGAELAGLRLLDRFVGTISPIFRSSRLEIDMHYNPPGIRGEPRYLEGVAYFTKLHGSLDWVQQNGYIRRVSLPYGADNLAPYLGDSSSMMIYPNSSKDRETAEYPYVELFRDLAAAVCRPNSTLVLYGYSFGDDHVNRVIEDMLTIPSTHLVIISYEDTGNRAKTFYEKLKRPAQITLLIGNHFGDLKTLVDNYLPKAAIDKASYRMSELLRARGWDQKKNDDSLDKQTNPISNVEPNNVKEDEE